MSAASLWPTLPWDEVSPGTKRQGAVEVELAGTTVTVPYTIVRGSEPGPKLLVTAGIHGAEYASIEAAIRAARVEPAGLRGTLCVLPVANPPAFKARSIYVNPLDGKNLNRCFPGEPEGSYAEQLAAWLTEAAIGQADYFVDLHGGDLIEALAPFTLYIAGDERARELAVAFGIPRLVATGPRGTTTAAGHERGVPSILAEAGGNGLRAEEDVAALADGVQRVMRHLGMLEGAVESVPVTDYARFAWLFADGPGYWYPAVVAGDRVREGDEVGRIEDVHGRVLQRAIANADGDVLFVVTSLAINAAEPLVGIGAEGVAAQ